MTFKLLKLGNDISEPLSLQPIILRFNLSIDAFKDMLISDIFSSLDFKLIFKKFYSLLGLPNSLLIF